MIIMKRGVGTETHKVETKREVFDPYSRKHYEDKAKGMEHVLSGGTVNSFTPGRGYTPGTYKPIDRITDKAEYRKNMLSAKKHAEKGCVINLTPDVKNALYNKLRTLKREVLVGMVRKGELHPVRNKQIIKNGKAVMASVVDNDVMTKTKAVERNVAWYRRNQNNLREVKRILRVLEPDNPKITNVEEVWRPS